MIPMIRAISHLLQSLGDGTTIAVAQSGTSSGSAVVAPQNGDFTNTAITVTNVSQSLVSANNNRRYLMIQNKDLVGNIWVRFGAGVTMVNGLQIAPGGSYEPTFVVPRQAIHVIGDLVSNANVVVVES